MVHDINSATPCLTRSSLSVGLQHAALDDIEMIMKLLVL